MMDPVERLKKLGLTLRNRNGVDWRTAKFELPREHVRAEYFRGRDFERYFAAHKDILEDYTDKTGGKSVEERTADLGNRFLKSGLITKAQRKYKRPKPGKPRLVKWPRTLTPFASKDGWERDLFYVWGYSRPTSAWTYIYSSLLVVTILAGCLLPIAPNIIKLCVFYVSATMLFFILGLLTIRAAAWMLVWLLTGKDFWILPNITSDEISLKDAFTPWVSFTKTDGVRSHILLRVLAGVGLGVFCWFLLSHNPGSKGVRQRAREAHDTVLDFLAIKHPSRQLTESKETREEL